MGTSKIQKLFMRLDLHEAHERKLKTSDVLQITSRSVCWQESCKDRDLAECFLQRLLMMDYRARYIRSEEEEEDTVSYGSHTAFSDVVAALCSAGSSNESEKRSVHPMDVQMAVFHCSDQLLKQLIVTKLSECQYALPLLVPSLSSTDIQFPLWTFQQIKKSWMITDSSGETSNKTMLMSEAETPMVAFFRFGSLSSSKSLLMNNLINDKHHTFFHRHCPGSSKNRLLMDGVVEIAWFCPSRKESDHFTDCVAFCNLHGEAVTHKIQLDVLVRMSSVNVLLLSDPKLVEYKEMLQKLFSNNKPLIFLLADDESGLTPIQPGKYKIGLKGRNQSDVERNLRTSIKECLSKSPSTFKLEDLQHINGIINDENDAECNRGKMAAMEMMSRLERNTKLSNLKEKHLPCQGKLWHEWCRINKELYRLQEENIEIQKCAKEQKMKQIREMQRQCGSSDLMSQFISSLNSLHGNERSYFLKWVGILLDKCTSEDLSALYHKYNETWTKVSDLKRKHDKSSRVKEEQTELEEISRQLNAATFGLEHILREMAQIYESVISGQTHDNNVSALPRLAAQLIKSGHPMELMDGDAAHVPLIWVSAVLDELVKILGDQRMFVLSILGIQSSGKSTMLNAMFGLQFAVSAGRCTRGAFMQLVRVSEEKKEDLKFDYILVVDTEGLRALELAGTSTRHHDNELATFVVGLGNLTLINIFGENPADMQDILQIVVQAFLRMKKVRLNPSCVFVHQNVGDITAGEKNMEGRRRLQENLDKMAKLAAKEEDSEADCFSDIIDFDVKTDVYYFAQLWEGSPPMAPPNPSYSRNVQNLKNAIFKKALTSHVLQLSQFKFRICDLWNALLSENFVFSFKNTLEIVVYRKLETEFGKWTWALRSNMLAIEEKFHNRIENENLERKIEGKDLYNEMKKIKEEVDKSMNIYFEDNRDKDILIQWRMKYKQKITQLLDDLVNNVQRNLREVLQLHNTREIFKLKATQREYDEKLFNLSKELAQELKGKETDEVLQHKFNSVWDKWVTDLTQDIPSERAFSFWEDVAKILSEGSDQASVYQQISDKQYRNIDTLGDYSLYTHVNKNKSGLWPKDWTKSSKDDKPKLSNDENKFVGDLTRNIIKVSEEKFKTMCISIEKLGYKDSYIQVITDHVKERVRNHNKTHQVQLTKEFTLHLCLQVCNLLSHGFMEHHKRFRDSNDPRVYLSKQKPQYYSVFKCYCRGATTTHVFGELICRNLMESILQAAYNKTAVDLAAQIRSDMAEFNGNRSNLEKHILKHLAEEENFANYMEYVHRPREYFTRFISEQVQKYITENHTKVLQLFKENLKVLEQSVVNALIATTEEVKKSRGGADKWLIIMSHSLRDEIHIKEITFTDHKDVKDFDFLQQVVSAALTAVMSELNQSFNCVEDFDMTKFRKKPDEILIEHLCGCCWVQCPFCKAICTNTVQGHDGDHSVPFHRVTGVNGFGYRRTTYLNCSICTTNMQGNGFFYHSEYTDDWYYYKGYRRAGPQYANWSITPDNSGLLYWKWFVYRFQNNLQIYYNKVFKPNEIPSDWGWITKQQAIESLNNYI